MHIYVFKPQIVAEKLMHIVHTIAKKKILEMIACVLQSSFITTPKVHEL